MNAIFEPFRSLPKFKELPGGKFMACCPAHQEKTPSMRGVIKGTRLLLTCHGCHASADTIRQAMGLPWDALFTDRRGLSPHDQRKWRIAQREREKAAAKAEAEDMRRIAAYCAIADDLNDRDAILRLDWTEYEGPETWDMLAGLLRDYARLEYEYECLRHPMV